MLNKKIQLLVVVAMTALTLSVHAAPVQTNGSQAKPAAKNGNSTYDEKVNLMKRDQIDNSDVYAIQLDNSEIEDEEEINKLEGKNVFDLPQSKPTGNQPKKTK